MISSSSSYISQQYQNVALTQPSGDSSKRREDTTAGQPVQSIHDSVTVSDKGRSLSKNHSKPEQSDSDTQTTKQNSSEQAEETSASQHSQLQKLQARDREVKTHEQAHLAAAGQYARGGASFTYETGPDGKVYAVGGEVSIDVGKEATPEATIAKMQVVRRAALAPAQPSGADRQIASQATAQLNQAQQQAQKERMEEIQSNSVTDSLDKKQAPSSNDSDNPAGQANSNIRSLMAETYRAVNEYL